ncbi:LysR family transcriptional regulator [Bordetella sp. BOR01]|uniref:LysR family transcriptional regulator n=1 Tax=Bordetella sp. BOR01 TaxID=2854779 RepID=UPI001C4828AD|nr:LysR family transcriptional regulator [Bordetella sp. BOR01]MBV7483322.1 LysR family transcriptional regulator [Bordetella sp. BOR01]
MNLRHVRYFVTLAEELNFTRAAARCHIEQAPFSRAIRTLERELGLTLLIRNTRNAELTPAGRLFCEAAKVALQELELGARRARRAQDGATGQLTIAHVGSTVYELLPSIIRMFKHTYPLVDLRIRQMTTREQIPAIIAGDIDVGFVRVEPENDQLETVRLFFEPFVCAISDWHPLASREALALAELAPLPFITLMRSPAPSLHQQVLDLCRKAGFEPKIAQEVEQIESTVGLVSSGIGVALVPASLRRLSIRSVCYVPLSDVAEQVEVWLTWPRGHVSSVARAFVQCARDTVPGVQPFRQADQVQWCARGNGRAGN